MCVIGSGSGAGAGGKVGAVGGAEKEVDGLDLETCAGTGADGDIGYSEQT